MGLKQRFNIVLIGIMKAVEGLAILRLICGAISLPTHAQAVIATVAVGTSPCAVAVNPNTNHDLCRERASSNNVTVIDGATNNTTTVAAGTGPYAVAVNPNTNQIYVANQQQQQRDGD